RPKMNGGFPLVMKPLSRRHVLGHGSLLASALAGAPPLGAAASQVQKQAATETGRKLKIIVTGGHPGDPEYGCGGTIARYTDMGHEVVLLYLNRGDTEETPSRPARPLRGDEGRKACEILGARPAFAGQVNGHAIVDAERYGQFRE